MGLQPGKPTNDPINYFAFGKQTAKGAEASTFHFMKHLDGTGFVVDRDIQREREGGDGQEVGFSYVSLVKADGAAQSNMRAGFTARVNAGVLGADVVSSAAIPSLARHTSFPAASLPYYTCEQRFSDELERAPDCVFTNLSIEGEAGRPWKVNAQFISGGTVYQRDVASALTPARETGKPFFYAAGSYIFDGGASYAADWTKIKVEVQRNVDDGIQTTGLGRDDVVPLNFDTNVEGTLKYTSRAFYQKVLYNGGSVVISDLATGSVDLVQLQQVMIASGVYGTGMMRYTLPLFEWTDAKVNKLDPDGKTVYLDVVGMGIKGATSQIIAVVDTNENTAYA